MKKKIQKKNKYKLERRDSKHSGIISLMSDGSVVCTPSNKDYLDELEVKIKLSLGHKIIIGLDKLRGFKDNIFNKLIKSTGKLSITTKKYGDFSVK